METSKNQQQSQPAGPRFESELLSRKEAAVYLGIAEQTLAIWHCTKRYDLPCAKIGRLVRYRLCRNRSSLYYSVLKTMPTETCNRSAVYSFISGCSA